MSDIKVDKYDLNYSEKFIIEGIEEQNIDLNLQTSEVGSSSVTGKITDTDSKPIKGVTVKLFDKNGNPFRHTITDAQGNYVFTGLSSDNYSISAVKTGTILTVPVNFFLQEEEIKTFNKELQKDPSLELCSIAGHIMDNEKNIPLKGAYVSLIDKESVETISSTMSADDGEFVFYDVEAKTYLLKATKDGYSISGETEVVALNNTIVNIDIKLSLDPINNVGTISGIIKNNNIPVSNCFVGLYKLTTEGEKEIERLVATTKTNTRGIYMFGDVTSGNYKVKSKQNK